MATSTAPTYTVDMTSSSAHSARSGPSIGDVARLAGVSSQTVSRVANGSDKVRPGTREKVIAAMNQLGYSPNHAARALRRGAFHTIGLMGHRFERTGEALTTSAVIAAATAQNYAVTIVTVSDDEDDWESAATRLSSQAIDGLVILRAEQTPEQLHLPHGLPVAVSDSRLIGRYPAVGSDHAGGSIAATTHLLELGHRQVHHIAGPEDSDPAQARAASWKATLDRNGVAAPEPFIGDWTATSGYEIGRRVAESDAVTALYCANDEMAIGAMRAFHELGVRVPEDISVVGFDDLELSAHLPVPLTTVHQDFHAIGESLVELVLEQIRSRAPGAPNRRVAVPTDLVVRSTTAPPRQ